MKPEPTLLGDGVHAEFVGGMIRLTVQRPSGKHEIYLEPGVYKALVEFAEKCWGMEE